MKHSSTELFYIITISLSRMKKLEQCDLSAFVRFVCREIVRPVRSLLIIIDCLIIYYICIYTYVYMCVCMYACMYVCMHVCMYVCAYVCMCAYVCVWVQACMCAYYLYAYTQYNTHELAAKLTR